VEPAPCRLHELTEPRRAGFSPRADGGKLVSMEGGLTPEQRQSERAVLAAFAYDCIIVVPYTLVAIEVNSLTMIGEVLRGVPLITVAIVSWLTLRRIHRGRTGGYDFGLGKHEQILALAVGMLLILAAIFIVWKAVLKLPEPGHGIGWLNAAAVVFVFLNLLANSLPLLPLLRAARNDPSAIVRAQLRAKTAKTVGSVIVVASVALNQLGSDPIVALWADRVGVAIVVIVTLQAAYDLIRSALPDLLDRTLAEPLQIQINRVLAEHFEGYESIEWCRSRQSGSQIEIDIGLGFPPERPFGEVAAFTRRVVDRIETEIPGSEATVTAVLPGRAGAAASVAG
jgi:ferrous-iron efflux pump FieF